MEEYYIGYIFDGLYPPEAAQWCNKNGTCHIEKNKDGKYEIVENVDREEPEHPIDRVVVQAVGGIRTVAREALDGELLQTADLDPALQDLVGVCLGCGVTSCRVFPGGQVGRW